MHIPLGHTGRTPQVCTQVRASPRHQCTACIEHTIIHLSPSSVDVSPACSHFSLYLSGYFSAGLVAARILPFQLVLWRHASFPFSWSCGGTHPSLSAGLVVTRILPLCFDIAWCHLLFGSPWPMPSEQLLAAREQDRLRSCDRCGRVMARLRWCDRCGRVMARRVMARPRDLQLSVCRCPCLFHV
jgi:hypothetical protein